MLSNQPGTQGNMRTCLHCCLYSTAFFSCPSRDLIVFLRTTKYVTLNFTERFFETRCINFSTANLQPDMATESSHCRLGTTTNYFNPEQFRIPTPNDIPGRPGCRLSSTEQLYFKHLQSICT